MTLSSMFSVQKTPRRALRTGLSLRGKAVFVAVGATAVSCAALEALRSLFGLTTLNGLLVFLGPVGGGLLALLAARMFIREGTANGSSLTSVEKRLPAAPLEMVPRVTTSHAFLLQLLDQIAAPIRRTGPDGEVIYVNQSWQAFVGPSCGVSGCEDWTNRIHPDDRPRVLQRCQEALAARKPLDVEYQVRHADATWHQVLERSRPLERNGDFAGFISILVDVTSLRAAEKQLVV